MIDPITKTRFRPEFKLETWYPDGMLDALKATLMAHYLGFEEWVSDEPFNRYTDLSHVTGIQLDFKDIDRIAQERRTSYDNGPAVKSAIFAPTEAAYGVARMFAALMETSPIEVRVFGNADEAAGWLEVPVEALREES